MNRLRRRALLASALLAACGPLRFAHARRTKSSSVVPPLEKWKVSDPPRVGSDELYDLNNNGISWEVFLQNGKVSAQPYKERKPKLIRLPFDFIPVTVGQEPKTKPGTCLGDKKRVAKVADGWLIFRSAGEWGGRVDWFSPDGTKQYKVSDDQVAQYAQTLEGLFAVQGLAHLGTDTGTFIQFEQNAAGKWKAHTLIDLKSAPGAMLPEASGTFLVVTDERLVRVRPADKTITSLLKANFWGILYPNSLIAAPNGDSYIGMTGGVAHVAKTNGAYKVRWLTPPAEPKRNA